MIRAEVKTIVVLEKDYDKEEYYNEDFACYSKELTTLKGCPRQCCDFDCSYNNLTTLKGCPKKVSGDFDCCHNYLKILKGCPKEIGGDFLCSNNNLTTLKGCPEKVLGDFDCSNNQLITLKGCPQEVGGRFFCYNNDNLKDISALPSNIRKLSLQDCYNVKIFTKEITTEDGLLMFHAYNYELRQRIKQWKYYDVVDDDGMNVTVKIKSKGQMVIDSI